MTVLHAQDNEEGKISQELNSESENEISAQDPSPEKAQEAAEKKQSLEELLAVPFNQIKEEQALELGFSEAESSDNVSKRDDGEVKLPPPPQQRKVERDIEKKLDQILREKLPKEYVGVSVSIRYILETVPVTKQDKKISKIKLPGFENNVWVPTQTEKVIGIVNQVRPYTTIFAVVNTPVSLFNVEVLRQTLDERIKFLNLTGRDVLKFVHVPFTTPAKSFVKTLDNAAEELTEATQEDAEIEKVNEEDEGFVLGRVTSWAGKGENAGYKKMLSLKTRDEWGEIFDQAGLIWGPVLSLDEVPQDPHAVQLGMFPEIEHPTMGSYATVNIPMRFATTDVGPKGPAPRLGEHTDSILETINCQQAEVDSLKKNGIVLSSQ